jgi:hypothetical protein
MQEINDVIYSDNRTVVLWADGTKTVTQPAMNDQFDPEVGLAMAITQRLFGSRNKFVNFVSASVEKANKRKPSKRQLKNMVKKEGDV